MGKIINAAELQRSFLEYPSLWVQYEIRELPAPEAEVERIITDVLMQAKKTILNEIEEQPEIDCSKLTRDEIARILLQWLKAHPGCRIRTDFEVRQGKPEFGNFVEFQYGNITEVY